MRHRLIPFFILCTSLLSSYVLMIQPEVVCVCVTCCTGRIGVTALLSISCRGGSEHLVRRCLTKTLTSCCDASSDAMVCTCKGVRTSVCVCVYVCDLFSICATSLVATQLVCNHGGSCLLKTFCGLQQFGQSTVSTSEPVQLAGSCHFRDQCFGLGL